MTAPLEERLNTTAKARGWRLRWSEEMRGRQRWTYLDIYAGKTLLTDRGPFWNMQMHEGTPRERIASVVLRELRRNDPPSIR